MLPTKKRCPRCGRVLPAEASTWFAAEGSLPGGAVCATTAIISTARKPGFVRKNPSGRRIAHGGYTDAVGRYIDLG